MKVGSSGDKLTKQAEKFLDVGELIVARAKCLPRGASRRRAAGGVFGVFGILAAGKIAPSGPVLLGRPVPKNLALAVTDRRVLVFRLSEATDKVAELTHSFPIGQVNEVHYEVGKSLGLKAIFIAIIFADGSTLSLEAVRPNTKDGEDVARALSTARSTR